MEFLQNSILEYEDLYRFWNLIELCASFIILIFSLKLQKIITAYLCLYAGTMFGTFIGFSLSFQAVGFWFGEVIGILAFLLIGFAIPQGKFFVAGWIASTKLFLIVLSLYEMSVGSFWLCILCGAVIGGIVGNKCFEKKRKYIWFICCGVIGVCGMSGSVVSLYRWPMEANLKFLTEKSEYYIYFSTLMNCDFNIIGNQIPFLILMFLLFFLEGIIFGIYALRERKKMKTLY